MAKRRKDVYIKGQYGVNEFIYVDLLPEVKRIRQFNGQVIIILLLFVILSFVFIFLPYNSLVSEFEETNGLNQDLKHELTLTQEEYVGHGIDTETIGFSEDIQTLEEYALDYQVLLGDIRLVITQYNAKFVNYSYSLVNEQIIVTVEMTTFYQFEEMNSQLQRIPWVLAATYTSPQRLGSQNLYHSTFTLEVDFNVE